jgi:glycopeptide antibiotics resistance protein
LLKIAPDKWKHFLVGILMGAILQVFTYYLMPKHFVIDIILAFILVVVISYGFELFSLIIKKGHYDILDAVAGIIGGVAGMGIILLFICV